MGDLDVRIRAEERDPVTGVVGLDDVCTTTAMIRRSVSGALADGQVPFVVGSCCALVPGALAGVRDARRKAGLLNLDGHLDLYDQMTSHSGEAADMPVTVAIGGGPAPWVEAAGGVSVDTSDIWILGYRDREESKADGMLMPEDLDPPIVCLSTEELRRLSFQVSADRAVAALERTTEGFWAHLDLDIVDPEWFFANDAPVPAGIDWDQLTMLLEPVLASPALAGFSLGCYNPEKDREGANGRRIVEVLRSALSA